jgi:hypothetical protein
LNSSNETLRVGSTRSSEMLPPERDAMAVWLAGRCRNELAVVFGWTMVRLCPPRASRRARVIRPSAREEARTLPPTPAAVRAVLRSETRSAGVRFVASSLRVTVTGAAPATPRAKAAGAAAVAAVSLRVLSSVLSIRLALPAKIWTLSSPAPASTQTVFWTVGPTSISSLPARASTTMTR